MKKEDIEDLLSDWEEDDDEQGVGIDWQVLFHKLWNGRKTVYKITGIAFAVGMFFGITMTRTYTVNVLLAPELNTSSGRSGSLGSIASMLGMGSLTSMASSDAYSVTTYPEVIASTPFITDLFGLHVSDPKEEIDTTLVGYLMRDKGVIGPLLKSVLPESEEAREAKKNVLNVNKFQLTKLQSRLVKSLSKAITAEVDKKTGETTITVKMDNPVIAAQVAEFVCENLQKYIINYRTGKAQEDYIYYQKLADESKTKYDNACIAYANYQDDNKGLILQKVISEGARLQNEQNLAYQIYSQMSQQAALAKAKVQEQKPVFAVIEPATVPIKPTNSRKMPVLALTFLGFFGSVVWVLFLKEFWQKMKEMIKRAKQIKGETIVEVVA